MAEKKMTKKENFVALVNFIETQEVENKAEMLAFIAHEIELLEKKASTGNSKKAQEHTEQCEQLETALAEMSKPVTVTEFMKTSTAEIASLSNQKISALMKKCVEERHTVRKTVEKKTSYFELMRE